MLLYVIQYCGDCLMTGFPLQFLTLRLIYTEPPAICQLQSCFPLLALVPMVSALKALLQYSPDFLYSPVFLSNLGQQFAPCPPLYYGAKKSCWFFSLFSFLLFRAEWQLSSFLLVELETRNQYIYIFTVKFCFVIWKSCF